VIDRSSIGAGHGRSFDAVENSTLEWRTGSDCQGAQDGRVVLNKNSLRKIGGFTRAPRQYSKERPWLNPSKASRAASGNQPHPVMLVTCLETRSPILSSNSKDGRQHAVQQHHAVDHGNGSCGWNVGSCHQRHWRCGCAIVWPAEARNPHQPLYIPDFGNRIPAQRSSATQGLFS